MEVRKDVTKAFKRMLTINNQRTDKDKKYTDDSTKWAGSQVNFDQSNQDISFNDEIESKFIKKKSRYPAMSKVYKEDDDEIGENYLENMFEQTKNEENLN